MSPEAEKGESNRNHHTLERPLLERLWSDWETGLGLSFGASIVLGTTSYVLSYVGSSRVLQPGLYELSDRITPVAVGLLGLYLASRLARWAVSSYIGFLRDHHGHL